MEENLVLESFLGGLVKIYQDNLGYKSGVDAVLLASIVEAKPYSNILDIGSGVGVASLCLASRISNLEIYSIEANLYFHTIAMLNKQINSFASQFTPINGNLLNYNSFPLQFDIVMTNPPYYKNIPDYKQITLKQQGNIENDAKLADFIHFAFKNLKNKGYLYMIQRSERLKETIDLLLAKHWGNIEINPVYSYENKAAKRFIIKAQKQGSLNSKLNSGIIMHDDKNKYTQRAENILRFAKGFY